MRGLPPLASHVFDGLVALCPCLLLKRFSLGLGGAVEPVVVSLLSLNGATVALRSSRFIVSVPFLSSSGLR